MLAVGAFVASLAMPRWLLLAMVATLNIALPTVYVAGAPLYAVAMGLMCLVRLGHAPAWPAGTVALAGSLGFGAVASLIATAWSPDVGTAVSTATAWLALVPALLLAVNVVTTEGLPAVGKLLLVLTPIVLAQAISTVVFRLSPPLEASYYQSGLASFFLADAGAALFTPLGANNVTELDRAGGMFFVNLNRASMVMGVLLLLYATYALLAHKRWPWLITCMLGAAIVLGGSKTGLALLVVLPLFAWMLARAAVRDRPESRMGLILVAVVLVGVGLQLFFTYAVSFISASEATLEPRRLLWDEAWQAIAENPVLGLGFSGWTERWISGGVGLDFSERPVHNWVLQAWLDGGVLLLAASTALVLVVSRQTVRSMQIPGGFRQKFAMAVAGSGLMWVFIHGLGDNTSVIGDPHNAVPIVVLAALSLCHRQVGYSDDVGVGTEHTRVVLRQSAARPPRVAPERHRDPGGNHPLNGF